MNRLTRINTVWRKELTDTLRDRRTLIAMILVPMVLYPAMMLGSLQGLEFQLAQMQHEGFTVGVLSEDMQQWLRRIIDEDPARQPGAESRPAEELVERAAKAQPTTDESTPLQQPSAEDQAMSQVRAKPAPYRIEVYDDIEELQRAIFRGDVHAGVLLETPPPKADGFETSKVKLVMDETEDRSRLAVEGLQGIFGRLSETLRLERLARESLPESFVTPIDVTFFSVATPEKVGGSILGRIVPLILIMMTLTGAVYPAIDLTAGERERGTLETLMVAPVPTVELIAGKFVVVALIALLSAALNLLSIGGTIYLGGLGSLLTQGSEIVIPLSSLPWVLMVLVPLAVMFSAALLAVCSFARSFKEAQNYIMPVMVAAMIPAVVGILPGTRLDGPMLIVPVANIVLLSRDLFTGQATTYGIIWVMLSTTLYAGAAVAVAAKLFGQEAVLFADSGSIKTVFQRKFFKRRERATTSQAFLLLAVVFIANFFLQQQLLKMPGVFGTMWFWVGIATLMLVLFVLVPTLLCAYLRVNVASAFAFRMPSLLSLTAAVCFGLSTWVLAQAWFSWQSTWLPMPPEMEQLFNQMVEMLRYVSPWVVFFFMALVPGVCEELFFRGFALNGLRGGLGKITAIIVVAVAFGLFHASIHRLFVTSMLGVLFGILALQYQSVWPAVVAHVLHNGISVMSTRDDALKPFLQKAGYVLSDGGAPPVTWIIAAAVLTTIGILICLFAPRTGNRTAHSS